jgi:tellurite resistance protein TerC
LNWVFFWTVVLVLIAIDLFIGRPRRVSTLRNAAIWTGVWVAVSVAFGAWIAWRFGHDAAAQYFTAYVLEKSLSVDNVFVFALIFSTTQIPQEHQHRVLLYGVLGALVMRGLLIAAGVSLLEQFHWVIYPFALLLLISAIRLLFGEKTERRAVEESCGVCTTWVARLIPVIPHVAGGRFLTRDKGRRVATPLFVALIIVETTDIIFALDSIPAALSITRTPFLVYSSNVFAMMGLRALYFLLAGTLDRIRYLRLGLAIILLFVSAKMLLEGVVDISVGVSLGVIAAVILGVFVAPTAIARRRR